MNFYIINETNEDINTKDIEDVCTLGLKILKVRNPILSIILVNEEKIREINKTYRNNDKVTDVISFAFEEIDNIKVNSYRNLGEIYICVSRAKEQAIEYNHSFEREICYLSIHGLLHLLGYDHMVQKDKKIMRKQEERIMNKANIRRNNEGQA
ncbi:MAG: rRNA maturation RNase YbeY [Bacilli bacterium]